MSWTVEGREYHNWDRYQEALRRRDQRQAEARAARAQREAQRLRERLSNQRKQLEEAQNNIREQQKINARIDKTVQSMRRNQERLQQAQENLSSQMDDMRTTHREHVESVERQFQEVQEELHAEIQQESQRAARERAALETKLTKEINSVDTKVEDLRKQIRDKERLDREIAEITIAETEAMLNREQDMIMKMKLDNELRTAKERIGSLQDSLAKNLPGLGITAKQIQVEVNGLVNKAYEIEAEMEAFRESAQFRINQCKADLEDQLVDEFYSVEKRQFLHRIQQLEQSVQESYSNPSRREIEAVEHEKQLKQAEHIVDSISAEKQNTLDLHESRILAFKERIPFLQKHFGMNIEEPNIRMEDPEDKKSALLVTYKTHDRTIEYRLNLDGSFYMDGHGYSSNSACQSSGRQAINAIRQNSIVEQEKLDETNRTEPSRAVPQKENILQEHFRQFTQGNH